MPELPRLQLNELKTAGQLYPIELMKGEFKAVQDFRKSRHPGQNTFSLPLQNALTKVPAMVLGREPSSLPVDYSVHTSDSIDNASATDIVADEGLSFMLRDEHDGYGHYFSSSSFWFA